MIYFDNGATGGFKPSAVINTAQTIMKYLSANPGRSAHRLSLTGAKIISECRDTISRFFNCSPDRVIFTKNCTEALNLAIFGTLVPGGHVITTIYEHNSVLRPLTELSRRGVISLDIIDASASEIVDKIADKILPCTYLIVANAVSNVTGESLPIKQIGKLCKDKNVKFICDGAQAGGHIKLDLKGDNINALCLAGHKGLYGIMGSGVLVFDDQTEIEPLIYGGTGSESFNLNQPSVYPERLESGTLNLPAISSLLEGVHYVESNINNFSNVLYSLTKELIYELEQINGLTLYSSPNPCGIVSFKLDKYPSQDLADILSSEYDVAVRGGLHCAPLIHKRLNTQDEGLLRVSLAVQNTSREIAYFCKAIRKISEK